MQKVFQAEMQVRGYEIDVNGHVNHSVYLNYAEFARWRMVEDSEAGPKYFSSKDLFPIIIRAVAEYKIPLMFAEKFVVETRLNKFRTRAAEFTHIFKRKEDDKVVAEITVTLMVMNKQGRAVTLPQDFERCFG